MALASASAIALRMLALPFSKAMPAGFVGAWTDTAFQEKRAEGQLGVVVGLAVLFAYLFLVALYESITIPIPVLLSVSVGILGEYIGRIYEEVKGRPKFIVDEAIGFGP